MFEVLATVTDLVIDLAARKFALPGLLARTVHLPIFRASTVPFVTLHVVGVREDRIVVPTL